MEAASVTRETNSMNAVDTNFLVYLFDADEPVKRAKAVATFNELLHSSQETILLWQVACEFLACLRRWQAIGKMTSDLLDRRFGDILVALRLVTPSTRVLESSRKLFKRYSLFHWDSLLVAAAIEAGVTTLYTEDFQSGARYDSLTVVNPFV